MRFSRFANIYEFIYEDESDYIIRHSILNKSFFLNEKEFNILINDLKDAKSSEKIETLKENHILVPDNYNEEKFVNFLKEKYNLNKFDLEIIYLIFNTDCNLRCKYCYVEGSTSPDFKHISMNDKMFEKMMDYIKKLIEYEKSNNPDKNKLTFIYYGSEPLMSKDYLIKSLEILQNICDINKIKPIFRIVTNGTLIDDNLLIYLKKFNVIISVSLDGPKKINDSMRITKNGKGTYDNIIKSIKMLNKSKIPFGISCTISEHNINSLNKNVDHFIKLGAKSIGFNILLNARYNKIPLVSLEKLNDELLEASFKSNVLGYYEDRIKRKINAFNGIPRFKDCGGVGNQLVFFPNGDISTCEAYLCNPKSIVGNISNLSISSIKNNIILKKWTKRYPLNMDECVYCPSLGICGGGCPFNAETVSKNIYSRDKPFCVHTEKSLNWMLKKTVESKTGKSDPYIRNISYMYSYKIF